MSKKRRIALVLVVCVVALAALGLLAARHVRRARWGPALPPNPPDREYAKEVIDLNNRGIVTGLDDPEQGLALFEKAIEADPEYHMAYANKAVLLVRQNRYEEAAECYRTLTELRPRLPGGYLGHAFCAHKLGNADVARDRLLHALSAYNYMLESEPAPYTRVSRVAVLLLLGREDEARKELSELQDSTDSSTATVAARLLKDIDQPGGADPWELLGPD